MGSDQILSQRSQMLSLWQWHRAAFEANHTERYLDRIREVSIASVKGEPLSSEAKAAMKADLAKSNKRHPVRLKHTYLQR